MFLWKNNHYICIPAIDIDSVLKIDKKASFRQAYLEQCKHKLKKRKRSRYTDYLKIINDDSDDIDYKSDNNSDDGYYRRLIK